MTVLPGPVRQVGYVVDDLDRAIAGWLELGVGPWFVMRGLALQADYRGRGHVNEVEKAGWPGGWSGGEGYGVRFAYVEPPNAPAAVIEISELTDATAANAAFIHDAAAEWDGTNPI